MTRNALKSHTRKELAAMARDRNVAGWHAMRKDELVEVLASNRSRSRSSRRGKPQATPRKEPAARANGTPAPPERAVRRLSPAESDAESPPGDSLAVSVCDPHWLLAEWSLTPQIIQRAQAALGFEWHEARPMIRVYDVTTGDSRTVARAWVQDVEIRGETDRWYVFVDKPARSYRLEIGYLSAAGRFFPLAASRGVTPPRPGRQASEARNTRYPKPVSRSASNGSSHGQ